jgi:predicted CXXCH cytochrome family protein
MRKIEIGVVCIALCMAVAFILPQIGVSWMTVDDTGCLTCHSASFSDDGNLHDESGHTNCTSCHDGATEKGNVDSTKCSACHPLTGDKGECPIVDLHDPGYGGTCASCHDSCSDDTTDTTTTAAAVTTTTAATCPSQEIYGMNSPEVQILRFVRDNILAATPEGQEIIRLYYQLSPIIVAAMQNDPAFKAEVKAMSDGVLSLVVQ